MVKVDTKPLNTSDFANEGLFFVYLINILNIPIIELLMMTT